MESSKEKPVQQLPQELVPQLSTQAAVRPLKCSKKDTERRGTLSILIDRLAEGVSSSMNEVSQNTSLRDTLPNGHISS